MAKLILKPGREKSLLRCHPWVFSGAVAQLQGEAGTGSTVGIRAADGRFLAWGAYSPHSQIVARVWSWRENKQGERRYISASEDLRGVFEIAK